MKYYIIRTKREHLCSQFPLSVVLQEQVCLYEAIQKIKSSVVLLYQLATADIFQLLVLLEIIHNQIKINQIWSALQKIKRLKKGGGDLHASYKYTLFSISFTSVITSYEIWKMTISQKNFLDRITYSGSELLSMFQNTFLLCCVSHYDLWASIYK